ncbi:MAG: hypothetical protein A3F13_09450 [Gammaproteobacteria bacterium RIFCSPHIGHO2_12_FULL_40_19]|nr:MAG: hypothetical protein A3F13_09450 [Gammaproteobacteria bacterium RIFCSPHIGHO2_12_FULL_40_19]
MNSKITSRLLIATTLVFPCLIWAYLDKSVWFWDPAMYGLEAIRMWRYLMFEPSGYLHNMFTMIGAKAPMICWVGQFFEPLGHLMRYEQALLLMQIIFSAWMIVEVTRWKIFSSSLLTIILGALLVASTPDFIFQSHFYFVELSQAFGVLMTFGLYLRRKELNVVYITCAYFALFFYLLGVKITSPCYIFFPTLGLLYECWMRRTEYHWRALKQWPTKLCLILAIVITTTVTIWYATNAMSIYAFAKNASSGGDALLYGHKASLLVKFQHWLPYFCNLFFGGRTRDIFIALIGLCFIGRFRKIIDQPFCFAIAQVALLMLAVCLQINEETRYIYPLLAYWVYIFGRIIVKQPKWLLVVFICILAFRWVEINLATLGVWPLNTWMPWSDTIDTKGTYLNQAHVILEKTVDGHNPKPIVIGVELRQLNANLLQFKYFTQHRDAVQNYPIYSIGYAQNSIDKAMENIKQLQGEYLITQPQSLLKTLNDPWNRVSLNLALRLQKAGWRTFATGPDYLILKKPTDN